MTKKLYVFDTSACLTDANIFYKYGSNDISVPYKVLEELDKQKKRIDIPGSNARKVIRFLDNLRKKGNLNKGIRIAKGKGILYANKCEIDILPKEFDINEPDNQIIATALTLTKNNPDKKIILVSRDINMRVKCDSLNIICQDYEIEKAVEKKEELYTGFETILVDDEYIDLFYEGKDSFLTQDKTKQLYYNQFLMLISNSDEKKTALARFKDYNSPLLFVNKYKKDVFGIKPRNKEQVFAMDLLLDPNVPVVSLTGLAGSGKTLIALAAALHQTIGKNEHKYDSLIVSRPIVPMGKDIGFLPGSVNEKLSPWIQPIIDNLNYLIKDKLQLQDYLERGIIEVEALTYIRGRSIPNAFIMIDETQNLSKMEIKTIITRIGEGSKIVLTGDVSQIDTFYNEITNGLTHAIEKLKEYDISGHVTLLKGERSKVATLASKVL